ncbi:MAG: type II secretory ATPase GspE/PulE/Tfp pilus assembly ATPase PilB-like protein [Bradymonadia bacterium]
MKISETGDFTELSQFDLDPNSGRVLPKAFCVKNQCVLLGEVHPNVDTPVKLGMVDVNNDEAIAFVEERTNRSVEPVRLNKYEIERALIELYEPRIGHQGARVDVRAIKAGADASATDMVNSILWDAVKLGASDVHIERYADDVDLRVRVDGMMHQLFTHVHPKNLPEVSARIKVLASMDITQQREPLDGRARIVFVDGDTEQVIDFRVSVLPGLYGPDIVLRVLDPTLGLLSLEDLGFDGAELEAFRNLVENPEGLLLVVGPTGSGKTTTLYSAIEHLRQFSKKIITAEDPVEYYIDKVNQKQVSDQVTLAELLRASLRQNPDALMLGEIRDRDTASTAMMAAATGHLVLSTLHTSDAIGTIVRLRGLGIDDFDLGSSLLAVVSQRLVRTICIECRRLHDPSEDVVRRFDGLLDDVPTFIGDGCAACNETGYKGRTALYELLVLDETLQDMVLDGAHRVALRQQAEKRGFRSMLHHGLDKVGNAVTTPEELLRVIPYRQIAIAARSVRHR